MAKQFGESLLADSVHTVFMSFCFALFFVFFDLMQVPRSSWQVLITMFC